MKNLALIFAAVFALSVSAFANPGDTPAGNTDSNAAGTGMGEMTKPDGAPPAETNTDTKKAMKKKGGKKKNETAGMDDKQGKRVKKGKKGKKDKDSGEEKKEEKPAT